MSCSLIAEGGVRPQAIRKVLPVKQKFDKFKGHYRINLWVERREGAVGKLTQNDTGKVKHIYFEDGEAVLR